MKTAILYVRVSTEKQAEQGLSLETQKAKLQAWCLVNGHDVGAVHIDAGISGGRSDNRLALQAALGDVCKVGGVLVVYSLSRLARSTKDTLAIAEKLEKADADLVSLSERIDTQSAAGKMVFRMLAVLAEFERDLASERTTAILQHKIANRERVGSVKYGFDLAEDGVHLIPNTDEQRVLELIQELRQSGRTLRAIAEELTSRGIPTKGGKSSRWSFATIQGILGRAA